MLLRQESAITQDLGRHLRLGEMIVAGGDERKCALFSNCLTFTHPDYLFVNHHWGSEIIFYLIHKWAGFSGIIIFKAIILGLTFLITVLHASQFLNTLKTQRTGDPENRIIRKSDIRLSGVLNFRQSGFLSIPSFPNLAIAVALTFLSIQMMADRLTTRPEIFGYLLFAILFWVLDRRKERLPRHPSTSLGLLAMTVTTSLIILIWVNLHISFIFGLILVWIWAGSRLLTSLRGNVSDRGNLQDRHVPISSGLSMTPVAIATASTIASTMIIIFNPSGLRGALMPLSILKDYGYTVVENMTPFFLSAFKPQPEYWIYTLLLLTVTVLLIISPKKPPLFSILTFYIFSIFPLIAVRHLPFFGLTTVPILTLLVAVKFRKLHNDEKFAKLPILVASSLLIAALTNPIPLVYGKLSPIGLTIDSRHNQAIDFVKQNNLQGQMWNNYDIGSFLEWAIPEHKTFVDGRPEAFPVGFFQDVYIPMQEDKTAWDLVATKYDIQWIFVALTDATPWFIKWWQMIRDHKDWRIVYIDNFSAVLVKVDSQNNLIGPQGKTKILNINSLD